MKRAVRETGSRTKAVRKYTTGALTFLGGALLMLLLVSGCQIGTGDAYLSMDPSEIDYGNMNYEFREYFQLSARDIVTEATVSGYPVEISMDMAEGGCGGPEVSRYWTLEDENRNPVPCPWKTATGEDGTLRFFLHFNGTAAGTCSEWAYTVNAFGEEGSAAVSVGENSCSEEEE